MFVCACACACVRACARACVCVCVRVRARTRARAGARQACAIRNFGDFQGGGLQYWRSDPGCVNVHDLRDELRHMCGTIADKCPPQQTSSRKDDVDCAASRMDVVFQAVAALVQLPLHAVAMQLPREITMHLPSNCHALLLMEFRNLSS